MSGLLTHFRTYLYGSLPIVSVDFTFFWRQIIPPPAKITAQRTGWIESGSILESEKD